MDSQHIKQRVQFLAAKLQDGTITDEEREEFEHWYNTYDDSSVKLDEEDDIVAVKERIYNAIEEQTINYKGKTSILRRSPWLRIAAAVTFCAIAAWLYTNRFSVEDVSVQTAEVNQILPGGQKAVLILSDGSKVVLDNKGNLPVLNVEGAEIKRGNGQLIYAAGNDAQAAPVFHTIQTPRGGTYELTLPDGTKVWLNAASSLKYPVSFTGNRREVELIGEAYFEVYKDKSKPFLVKNKKLNVEVLGTHFNMNAYDEDKEVKTTLYEGKVKLVNEKGSLLLKPMQQAILNTYNSSMNIKEVDSEEAISWKNGEFVFESELISSVMQKISRWYDVEVVYEGPIPAYEYVGKISRDNNISAVLKLLSLTNTIRFKIEGRRVIVMQ
jgi:transmembrane sensor